MRGATPVGRGWSSQLPVVFTSRPEEMLEQEANEARWLEHSNHLGTKHLPLGPLAGQTESVTEKFSK